MNLLNWRQRKTCHLSWSVPIVLTFPYRPSTSAQPDIWFVVLAVKLCISVDSVLHLSLEPGTFSTKTCLIEPPFFANTWRRAVGKSCWGKCSELIRIVVISGRYNFWFSQMSNSIAIHNIAYNVAYILFHHINSSPLACIKYGCVNNKAGKHIAYSKYLDHFKEVHNAKFNVGRGGTVCNGYNTDAETWNVSKSQCFHRIKQYWHYSVFSTRTFSILHSNCVFLWVRKY